MAPNGDVRETTTIKDGTEPSKVRPIFLWINSHIGILSIVLVVLAVVGGIVGSLIADTDEPNFSPSGEIYDTEARADEVFESSSSIREAAFIVDDANGQDVLTQAALLEVLNNSSDVRNDPDNAAHCTVWRPCRCN